MNDNVTTRAGIVAILLGLAGVAVGQVCDPGASFDKPAFFESPVLANDVALGDLNGDGVLDAVIPEAGFDMIDVLLGDGEGSFGPAMSHPGGTTPFQVALGDMNGDGLLDVVATSREDGEVSVLQGNGDGTLAERQSYAIGGAIGYLTLGDLDADGDLDVVVNNDSMGFDVLKNAGDGTLSVPQRFLGDDFLFSLVLGDLDGDGDLDLTTSGGRRILVFLNNGQGEFAPFRAIPAPVAITNVGVADMDGDGDLDLVGFDSPGFLDDDGVAVFLNRGDATFDAAFTQIHGLGFQLALTDMDGDGDPDVVTTGIDVVHVVLNLGDGTVASAGRYAGNFPSRPFVGETTGLAIGDTDADGDTDVVTVRNRGGMGSVLFNRGDGTLASPMRVPFETREIAASDLIVVDLDNDGSKDIVVAAPDSGWPRAYFFEPSGAYVPGPEFGGFGDRSSLAYADFNGDGLIDIVAGEENVAVTVLLNGGDRTFDVRDEVRVDGKLVAAGDMNGDGLVDAVAGDGRFLSVLLGDGAGGLVEHTSVNNPIGGLDMMLEDVDGNGSLDVLVVSFGRVLLLLNDGTGTLDEPTLVLEANDTETLVIGDLNGDGLNDLVVFGFDEVVVALADGAGGFMVDHRYHVDSVPGLPATGAIGDVNGDGDPDIVLPLDDGETSVMLNNGDGTFAPPQAILADFLFSSQIVVADMDGDGTNDIVTADRSAGRFAVEVTVLLNQCRPADCPPDLDGDGELTVFDYLSFFNLFDAGSLRADFDGDGSLTIFDFLAFQNEFDAGCS